VVWQRDTSFAAPSSAYTADRWNANGSGTVTRTNANGGMTVTGTVTLKYTMEALDFAAINGKTVTLTWSQGGVVQWQTFTASSAIVFNKSLTNTTLEWVWLGIGDKPTLNPAWRPYQQESIICDRYYQKFTGRRWMVSVPSNAYTHFVPFAFKTMRSVPTAMVTFSGKAMAGSTSIGGSTISSPITAIVVDLRSNGWMSFKVTATAGTPLTATQTSIYVDTNWDISLDAEIY
jgi:hypothetical protein